MTTRFVEINIPGILSRPGRAEDWTDRAVTYTHLHYPAGRGEKFEYASGVFSRHIFQEDRAAKVAALADRYLSTGWRVYLRGHSNGCDVICRAIRHLTSGHLAGVHFIAPACPASFQVNGLNEALATGRVERVVICGSHDDTTLRLAKWSHPVLSLVGNGYGSLGLSGPREVLQSVAHHVTAYWQAGYGHSDWLRPEELPTTIDLLHDL